MKPPSLPGTSSPFLAVVFLLPAVAAGVGSAPGQTLEEALDTPGVTWTAHGAVTTVTGSELTFDGDAAARLDPDPSTSGGPFTSIETTVTQPSIFTFRHRSRDLDGSVRFGVEGLFSGWEDFTASHWAEPVRVPVTPGTLRITRLDFSPGGEPLFLDTVSLTPVPGGTLGEALDAPGLTFRPLSPAEPVWTFNDAALAPDGEDAVWLPFPGGLSADLPGNMVVSYTSSFLNPPPFSRRVVESAAPGAWSRGHFLSDAAGQSVQWSPQYARTATLDKVTVRPPVPLGVALDVNGLVCETLTDDGSPAAFGSSEAPEGAKSHHAVAMPESARLRVSGFRGPGEMRFSAWDASRPAWHEVIIPIPAGVTSHELLRTGWVDDLTFIPYTPAPAAWMGLPGATVTLPQPATVTAYHRRSPAGVPEEERVESGLELGVWPHASPLATELLRVSSPGPALISFAFENTGKGARVSVDGGFAFDLLAGSLSSGAAGVFAVALPGSGAHRVNVLPDGYDPVGARLTLRDLKIQPLVEVPLAEALDAPGMTFTTSSQTPWRGYRTGDAMGAAGGHAAFGGIHSGTATVLPWMETTVTGPGVLRFRSTRTGGNGRVWPTEEPAPLEMTVDGVKAPRSLLTEGEVSEVFVSGGRHTVRWTQPSANVGAAEGRLAWVDAVSFTPQEEGLSFGDALETGARAWSAGGGGNAATPAAWPKGAADGADCVVLHPAEGPATLSTVVERPFYVTWSSLGVSLSVDGAPPDPARLQYTDPARPGEPRMYRYEEPLGAPATLTFSAEPGQEGLLDSVRFYTPLSAASAPGGRVGTDPVWTLHGNRLSWLVNADDPAGPRYRVRDPRSGNFYAEAVISGPAFLGRPVVPGPAFLGAPVILPDRGGRTANSAVPFPGLNRVILDASNMTNAGEWMLPRLVPSIAPGAAAGAPELEWETGGDQPWMGVPAADGAPSYALTRDMLPGEVSWIQATVTGPGVLRWRMDASPQQWGVMRALSVDGVTVRYPNEGGVCYLHLPAGSRRVRWQATGMYEYHHATLRDVAFEAAPSPSLQDVTGLPDMPFLCRDLNPRPAGAPSWASLDAWTPLTGAILLNRAMDLVPVLPSPGEYVLTTMTRAVDPPLPAEGAPAIPHSWLPKTLRAPRGETPYDALPTPAGLERLLGGAVWRPAAEVSLAEALDTPDLVWTSGSDGEGEWRGYAGNSAGAGEDPDAAHLRASGLRPEAWMETQITGPARVDMTWNRPAPAPAPAGPPPGLRILIDGAEVTAAAPGEIFVPGPFPTTVVRTFSVPAGAHTVRILVDPPATVVSAELSALSRVTVTPEAAGPDIGALVEAPDLPWRTAGAVAPAEAAESWDGVDAARLTAPVESIQPALTTTVTGPGILSARVQGVTFSADEELGAGEMGGPDKYRLKGLVIPPGRRAIRITGQSWGPALVDAVKWEPLPALTAEEALAAVTPSSGSPLTAAFAEGAVYTGYPAEDPDSLLLPRSSAGPSTRLRLPGPCRVTFSARTMVLSEETPYALLEFGGRATYLPTEEWTTVSFTTDELNAPGGWLTMRAVYHSARVRDLVITPYDGGFYLPWMEAAGLTGVAAALSADPDGDGLTNALEHAFGLDPNKADARVGSVSAPGAEDFIPGLPEVSTAPMEPNGRPHMCVRFRGRHDAGSTPDAAAVEYGVEEAFDNIRPDDGEPDGTLSWGTARGALTATPVPGAPGWADFVWFSADPVDHARRKVVRVRVNTR